MNSVAVFGQRIVGPLAGRSGCSALVGGCSSPSTSLVQPAEHVGEHHAGVGGWRACCGSGGIAGGATATGGCIGCGALAQACSSSVSAHSVGASSIDRLSGSICGLLNGGGAALLLGARRFGGAGSRLRGLRALDVQHMLHLGRAHALGLHAAAVAGGEGSGQDGGSGGKLGDEPPGQRDHGAGVKST